MEETLTDCLVRMREDLSQLKRVREFLDSNQESQGSCSVTWRTIEAFNSILAVCSSQGTQEIDAMDTLLDSFYFLARNNDEASVWRNFGFELGIICVKILSVIEQTEKFDELFCKLLTVINVICEHGSDVWKAMARQILNVFINKKLSFNYFETVVKIYICILRNIDGETLCNFSLQNLQLLKTFSMFVHKVGDFEVQMDIMELVFLHLSKDKTLFLDFFTETKEETRKIFQSLQFADFEEDCRVFLNSLNKNRVGFERKVYSICCHILYFGGCSVEPPRGRKFIWVDANKESRRLSIKCSDFQGDTQRTIHIDFKDVRMVKLEHEKPDENFCITIRTTNLKEVNENVMNEDILCVALEPENTPDSILGFVSFLKYMAGCEQKKKKKSGRVSKTSKCYFFDRSFAEEDDTVKEEVQDNAISSSVKSGVDVLRLFEKPVKVSQEVATTQEKKPSQPSLPVALSPVKETTKRNFVLETQELTPNSFLESLNKHLGMDSPQARPSFEDSTDTVQFLQRNSAKKHHKLFRSPQTIFTILETDEPPEKPNFIFGENKENEAPPESENIQPKEGPLNTRVLRDKKTLTMKFNTESQEYFRGSSVKMGKKPTLPRLNRKIKTKKATELKKEDTPPPKVDLKVEKKLEEKPSLLDPNGYAFQRWLKPTTSERSNFWLRKLNENQKQKQAEHVFDFSDESESYMTKNKKRKKKRRVTMTKKNKMKETSRFSLKEKSSGRVCEMEKAVEAKGRKKEVGTTTKEECREVPNNPVDSPPKDGSPYQEKIKSPEFQKDGVGCDYDETPTTEEEVIEYEPPLSSDDEKPSPNQKRQLSESDNSITRTRLRKKRRTKKRFDNPLLSIIQLRLQKTEEKNRQQTNEIIETVENAITHFFNHMQKNQGRKIISYLNEAEEAITAFQNLNDLDLRVKRTQKLIAYFEAGCSVSEFCNSVGAHTSNFRDCVERLRGHPDNLKKIIQVAHQLKGLITSEIEKSFKNEMESNRNRLLRCVSVLDTGLEEDVLIE